MFTWYIILTGSLSLPRSPSPSIKSSASLPSPHSSPSSPPSLLSSSLPPPSPLPGNWTRGISLSTASPGSLFNPTFRHASHSFTGNATYPDWTFPSSVDWRTTAVTPVQDMGSCGERGNQNGREEGRDRGAYGECRLPQLNLCCPDSLEVQCCDPVSEVVRLREGERYRQVRLHPVRLQVLGLRLSCILI